MPSRRKATALVLLFLLLLFSLTGCHGNREEEPGSSLEEQLERILAYYRQERRVLDSWWELVALSGAGANLEQGEWQFPAWKAEDLPPGSAATSYAGFILGLLAQGQDPWNWLGRSLPAELASLQESQGSFGGTINNSTWAVVALEAAGFSYNREGALAHFKHEQQADGGFALFGSSADPDVTAMALLALSFHRGNPEAEAVLQKALAFLAADRLASGGYASYKEENANSVAMVLSALVAVGEDYGRAPWQGEEGGVLPALLAYQLADGSFSYFKEPLKQNTMATYQALLGLGDAAAGSSVFTRLQVRGEAFRPAVRELQPAVPPAADPAPGRVLQGTRVALTTPYPQARILYTLDGSDPLTAGLEYQEPITLETDTFLRATAWVLGQATSPVAVYQYVLAEEPPAVKPPAAETATKPPPEPALTVRVRVVGERKTYFNGTVKVTAGKVNALQALLETKLDVRVTGGFVESIAGERNAGISGWKYKVNSIIPGVSSLDYPIKENDTVLWWYADTPASTGP